MGAGDQGGRLTQTGGDTMRWLTFLTALVAAAVIGYGAMQPMRVKPWKPVPATAFSVQRAMDDVRAVAQRPHPTGSADNARVRALLVAKLRALGFEVRETAVPLSEKARAGLQKWREADASTAVNIVAVRPAGDRNAPLVALMAHYDSVAGSPGAADDGAGVAAALEIARALVADPAPRRGLAIVLTDAEELGLDGARGFFARDPLAKQIGMIINMETRGGGGRAIMFETIGPNGQMIDLLRRSVTMPKANSLSVRVYQLLPNNTDLTMAKPTGIPGYNFAFIGRAALYHSPLATPDALDIRSLKDMGSQALDLMRALLDAPALPAPAPDAVFSDVLGGFVIAYPAWVGWGIIAAAALFIGIAARRTRAQWRGGELIAGAALALMATLVTAALLFGFNLLSQAPGAANYYDRLAALPRLEAGALLIMLAGLGVVAGSFRPDLATRGGWIGLALLNLGITVAVQIALPAAGPLFGWPLLLASFALCIAAVAPMVATVTALVVAALGLAMLADFAHFLLLGIGISMPSAVAVMMPVAVLLLWPLRPPLERRHAWLLVLALLVAAAGLALWVRLDPLAASVATYSRFE